MRNDTPLRIFPFFICTVVILKLSAACSLPDWSEQKKRNDSSLRESWDAANDPGLMLSQPLTIEDLKASNAMSGEVMQPWSDSYWPLDMAGIAYRWIDDLVAPAFEIAGEASGEDESEYYRESYASVEEALESSRQLREQGITATWALSPAEKYDIISGNSDFALTRSELSSYIDNRRTYEKMGISWGWMGHCHGWAAASVGTARPQSPLLVKNRTTGESVFFSVGDIRALVTKIASDNGTVGGTRFAGTRCEDKEKDIPRDKNFRIVDAALGIWDGDEESFKPGARASFRALYHSRFDENEFGQLPYAIIERITPGDSQAAGPDQQEPIWVEGYSWIDAQREVSSPILLSIRTDDLSELRPDLVLWASEPDWIGRRLNDAGDWERDSSGEIFRDVDTAKEILRRTLGDELADAANDNPELFGFKSYKECRDINPATFHSALVHWLSDRPGGLKKGFVMDLAQTNQVWNQGVWKFESRLGEATPLTVVRGDGSTLEDPLSSFRAKGTETIIDVETAVSYGVEAGPRVFFSMDDEAYSTTVFRYTLEFDSAGQLIGGEWHSPSRAGPLSGAALLTDLQENVLERRSYWQQAPDFIWGSSEDKLQFRDSSLMRASVVESLLACSSQTGPIAGTHDWPDYSGGFQRLPYIYCEVE